jgi:hypothetical protein
MYMSQRKSNGGVGKEKESVGTCPAKSQAAINREISVEHKGVM